MKICVHLWAILKLSGSWITSIKTMPDLTHRLAKLIAQDNAVLFVGDGLRQDPDASPAARQIAESLAALIQYDRSDRRLSAVARDFEILQGRNALILALRQELEKRKQDISPTYQRLADAILPTTKVITTRFDQAIERALDQFQKPYILIVRDTDLPFFDESKIALIKMQGDITQPDSLIITEDDVEAFISRLPTVSDVVRAFFATKTLIFLGYDLNDAQFKRFYRQVTRNLTAFGRRAYAIVSEALDEIETRYWDNQNVGICPREPDEFLKNLAEAVKRAIKSGGPAPNPMAKLAAPPLPSQPYKALESYTQADELIFASRLEESYRLTNRILAHRLIVLYGESGSGKTSLLQAGAGPRLSRNRALLTVCQPLPGQPMPQLIRQSLLQAGLRADLTPPDESSLLTAIRRWQQDLDAPIVIALDQFEQFFLAYSAQEQQTVAGFLADLLADRSLDLRLVLVIREDFLGRLDALSAELPGLMDARFRLERLGREAARAAIEEPARLFNVGWESRLVQSLLDELYEAENGGVAPPQLQIVCDALYRDAVETAGEAFAEQGAKITLTRFQELGGIKAILGDHLNGVVGKFASEEQPVVQRLLGALVSSAGIKQRLPLDDLARAAGIKADRAAIILNALTYQRLLQRYEVDSSSSNNGEAAERTIEYELTHDYLVSQIADWLGADFWATQKVRELLRQALPEWQNRGRLLPLDDLQLAAMHRKRLTFSPSEVEMLYAAAVSYDELDGWQFSLPEKTRQEILLQLLGQGDREQGGRGAGESSARRVAVRRLADFDNEAAALAVAQTALSDPDTTVRNAAIEAIAQVGRWAGGQVGKEDALRTKHCALSRLITATADPATADRALQAITQIRDSQPDTQTLLPENLRAPIQRQVRVARWKRNRRHILAATVRGAQAGFWGLGLVMGPFFGLFNGLAGSGFRGQIQFRLLLGVMLLGLSLTGLLGALAVGGSAFFSVTLRSLQDKNYPWRTWGLTTFVGGLLFSLGFLLLGYITPAPGGEAHLFQTFLAGLLMGLPLTGAASLPVDLPRLLRLALTTLVGVGVFILVGWLGWAFNDNLLWLSVMGAAAGIGFGFSTTEL